MLHIKYKLFQHKNLLIDKNLYKSTFLINNNKKPPSNHKYESKIRS